MKVHETTIYDLPTTLADNQVNLYLINSATQIDEIEHLSADEVEVANQYRVEWKYHQFRRAKATLRKILGTYMDCDPSQIEFIRNRYGKPSVEYPIEFNLSHSKDNSIIAISQQIIGVDIEKTTRDMEISSFAQAHYHPHEIAQIHSKNDFYKIFTRKEAILKAIGIGLIDDLPSIDCSEDDVIVDKSLSDTSHWTLQTMDLIDDLACTVAAKNSLHCQCYYLRRA